MPKPPKPVVDAWIALNRAQRHVFAAIEAELKSAGLPPLAWYDVLLELWREPGGRLPPGDLRQKKLFPPYGISRPGERPDPERVGLPARLEGDGGACCV